MYIYLALELYQSGKQKKSTQNEKRKEKRKNKRKKTFIVRISVFFYFSTQFILLLFLSTTCLLVVFFFFFFISFLNSLSYFDFSFCSCNTSRVVPTLIVSISVQKLGATRIIFLSFSLDSAYNEIYLEKEYLFPLLCYRFYFNNTIYFHFWLLQTSKIG